MAPDSSPGELLNQVVRSLRRNWAAELGAWDLSPHQARALRVVAESDATRPTDLARALRIAPRSATEVVDDLAAKGLVHREPSPSDRRAVLVHLTDQGRAVSDQVRRARESNSERFFARLSQRDRADLSRILHRLMDDQPEARADIQWPAPPA
jgi:DNA-binding MarR family transcriptional regulator